MVCIGLAGIGLTIVMGILISRTSQREVPVSYSEKTAPGDTPEIVWKDNFPLFLWNTREEESTAAGEAPPEEKTVQPVESVPETIPPSWEWTDRYALVGIFEVDGVRGCFIRDCSTHKVIMLTDSPDAPSRMQSVHENEIRFYYRDQPYAVVR